MVEGEALTPTRAWVLCDCEARPAIHAHKPFLASPLAKDGLTNIERYRTDCTVATPRQVEAWHAWLPSDATYRR